MFCKMWKDVIFLMIFQIITIIGLSLPTRLVCGNDGHTYSYEDFKSVQLDLPDLKLSAFGPCSSYHNFFAAYNLPLYIVDPESQVCGVQHNSDERTYGSELELHLAKLEDPYLEIKHLGPCGTDRRLLSNSALLKIQSVCGSNAKTYNSFREFLLGRLRDPELQLAYIGSCLTGYERRKAQNTPEFVDDTLRTLDDAEFCGTDIKSYNNYDVFKSAQLGKPHLNILHRGPCVLDLRSRFYRKEPVAEKKSVTRERERSCTNGKCKSWVQERIVLPDPDYPGGDSPYHKIPCFFCSE